MPLHEATELERESLCSAQRVINVDVDEGTIVTLGAVESPSTILSSGRPPSNSAAKRKADDIGSDDENVGAKHSRKKLTKQDNRPRVGCPFYKRDPDAHHDKMSCRGTGFAEMGKLKDHLKDIHHVPGQTLQKLNFRSREFTTLGTIEEKWKRAYQILFSDTLEHYIPTPNAELPRSSIDLDKLCSILKERIFKIYGQDIETFFPSFAANFDIIFQESAQAVHGLPRCENTPSQSLSIVESVDCSASIGGIIAQLPTPDITPQLGRELTPMNCFAPIIWENNTALSRETGLSVPSSMSTSQHGREVTPFDSAQKPENHVPISYQGLFQKDQIQTNPPPLPPSTFNESDDSMYLPPLPELPFTLNTPMKLSPNNSFEAWNDYLGEDDFLLYPREDANTESIQIEVPAAPLAKVEEEESHVMAFIRELTPLSPR